MCIRDRVLERALAGWKAGAAVGAFFGACAAGEIVGRDAEEGAADRQERGADRRGLDEVAAIPGCLQLGIAIEVGFDTHGSLPARSCKRNSPRAQRLLPIATRCRRSGYERRRDPVGPHETARLYARYARP